MVSIAMATYNGERFLREQLDSIQQQTLQDYELVVCDDGSQDNTLCILEEYAGKDPRIKIHRNPHNLGFKKNFEQAIRLCKGDYIALCDQDDIWYPEHLQVLLDNIGDCSMVCGNSQLVDADNRPLGRNMSDSDGIHFVPEDQRKWLFRIMLHGSPFQGASMMLTKEFADRCLPIPDCCNYHDVWIAACACMDHGMNYLIQHPITRYRQHAENVTLGQGRDHKRTRREIMHYYADLIWRVLTRKGLIQTNRFDIADQLEERFVKPQDKQQNPYFRDIHLFLSHSRKRYLTLKDLALLWNNMDYITAMHSAKIIQLVRKWFSWTHMEPIVTHKKTK